MFALCPLDQASMPVLSLLQFKTRALERHIAEGIHLKLPDEKSPEDVHQHVRDRTRGQRHKNSKLRSIYDAMITSGVLEARQVVCPQVSKANLAGEAWYSATNRELLEAEQ